MMSSIRRKMRGMTRCFKGKRKPLLLICIAVSMGYVLTQIYDREVAKSLNSYSKRSAEKIHKIPPKPTHRTKIATTRYRPRPSASYKKYQTPQHCNAGDLKETSQDHYVANMKTCTRYVMPLIPGCGGPALRDALRYTAQANGVKVSLSTLRNNLTEQIKATYRNRLNQPALFIYEGNFFDFERFEEQVLPIYFGLMCDPVDLALEKYKASTTNVSMGTCLQYMQQGSKECLPDKTIRSYFCGNNKMCKLTHTRSFISTAKQKLLNYFAFGSTIDNIDDFTKGLEKFFPHLFKGLSKRLKSKESFLKPASHKSMKMSAEAQGILKDVLKDEIELYEFAVKRLNSLNLKLKSSVSGKKHEAIAHDPANDPGKRTGTKKPPMAPEGVKKVDVPARGEKKVMGQPKNDENNELKKGINKQKTRIEKPLGGAKNKIQGQMGVAQLKVPQKQKAVKQLNAPLKQKIVQNVHQQQQAGNVLKQAGQQMKQKLNMQPGVQQGKQQRPQRRP